MKVAKSQLKQIIKEELSGYLNELNPPNSILKEEKKMLRSSAGRKPYIRGEEEMRTQADREADWTAPAGAAWLTHVLNKIAPVVDKALDGGVGAFIGNYAPGNENHKNVEVVMTIGGGVVSSLNIELNKIRKRGGRARKIVSRPARLGEPGGPGDFWYFLPFDPDASTYEEFKADAMNLQMDWWNEYGEDLANALKNRKKTHKTKEEFYLHVKDIRGVPVVRPYDYKQLIKKLLAMEFPGMEDLHDIKMSQEDAERLAAYQFPQPNDQEKREFSKLRQGIGTDEDRAQWLAKIEKRRSIDQLKAELKKLPVYGEPFAEGHQLHGIAVKKKITKQNNRGYEVGTSRVFPIPGVGEIDTRPDGTKVIRKILCRIDGSNCEHGELIFLEPYETQYKEFEEKYDDFDYTDPRRGWTYSVDNKTRKLRWNENTQKAQWVLAN